MPDTYIVIIYGLLAVACPEFLIAREQQAEIYNRYKRFSGSDLRDSTTR